MNRSTWPTSRRRRRRRRGGGGERFFYCCGCHHQSCHYTLLLSSVQIEFKCFEFKSGLIPASIRRWWAMLSIGFLFCFVVSELISMALLLFDASVDGNCFCGLRASKPPRLIFTRPVDVAELSRRMRLYPLLPPPFYLLLHLERKIMQMSLSKSMLKTQLDATGRCSTYHNASVEFNRWWLPHSMIHRPR